MVTKILTLLFTVTSIVIFSQKEIYFKYDVAGNQVFRGESIIGKQDENTSQLINSNLYIDQTVEEKFWAEISIYPVPVKDILTVKWTNEINDLINTVSMYQYGIVNWSFQQKNISNLNRQIQINMSNYYMGVYVLSINLKDGRVYTRKILKQ